MKMPEFSHFRKLTTMLVFAALILGKMPAKTEIPNTVNDVSA